MPGEVRHVGICVAALLLALLCPRAGQAQLTVTAPPPLAINEIAALPDAPSASVPPAPQVLNIAQTNPAQTQSWWLVVPEDAPYRPLSSHEKFMSFVHHTFSPYTLAGSMYDAVWAQVGGDPFAYGGGMEGWGKRLGASVAGTETRSFFGAFLFPTLLHQDPRYFAMYKGPPAKRALHALSRVFVTRNDDGENVFNTSGMMTVAVTESLGMAWAPEGQRTGGKVATRALGALQGSATTYLLREFTPDILRFFKKHAPMPLRRLEQRMPVQMTGDTGQP